MKRPFVFIAFFFVLVLAFGQDTALQYQSDSGFIEDSVEFTADSAFESEIEEPEAEPYEMEEGSDRFRKDFRQVFFYLLILSFLLIAIAKLYSGGAFNEMFQGFLNLNLLLQFFRDRILDRSISAYLLSANYYILTGITLAIFFEGYGLFDGFKFLQLFLIGVLIVFSFDSARILLVRYFGWLFSMSEITGFLTFNTRFNNRICGLVLIPIVSLLVLGDSEWSFVLLFLALFLWIVQQLYGYYRVVQVSVSAVNGNWFHFILYICTLEIAPYILLFRVIKLES